MPNSNLQNVKNLPNDTFEFIKESELEHQEDIQAAKNWLHDWYSQRLPILNKSHL
jgi:hypothetical protein